MSRCLALMIFVVCVVGCSRYRSSDPSPFKKPPPPPPNYTQQPGPPVNQSPLALDIPTPPLPPGPPDQLAIVPPKPPLDPAVIPAGGFAVAAPKPPASDAPGAPRPVAPPSPAAINLAHLKRITQSAAEKWKTVDTYEAHLTRRESINGKDPQTEEVLFQFRKEPMSVYMRNVGVVGKGREVIYNPSKHGEKMHIVVGEGDSAFLRAGSKAPLLSPDSPQVKANSRHSIRDAGFGTTITKFATLVGKIETGKIAPDALKYIGPRSYKNLGAMQLELIEQPIRAGEEQLSKGGLRQWFFDADPKSPSFGLPVLVILTDATGREIEYYCFTQFRCPANLTEKDFDPARLGKKK